MHWLQIVQIVVLVLNSVWSALQQSDLNKLKGDK